MDKTNLHYYFTETASLGPHIFFKSYLTYCCSLRGKKLQIFGAKSEEDLSEKHSEPVME